MSIEDKEREAEEEFKDWLDKHKIPYWYIRQDAKYFSKSLKNYMTKRPDFMILIPNIGFILTDVKHKRAKAKYDNFAINKDETDKYINLQKLFNLPLWYVFSHSVYNYNSWHWIPVRKVPKCGKIYPTKDGEEIYSVSVKDTFLLSGSDGLERLLTKASSLFRFEENML